MSENLTNKSCTQTKNAVRSLFISDEQAFCSHLWKKRARPVPESVLGESQSRRKENNVFTAKC